MRIKATLIGLLIIALAVPGFAQGRRRPPAAPVPVVDAAALQSAGFVTHWEAKLPLLAGDRIENGFIEDEALYITTELGNVYALVADVGLIRWVHNITEPDFTIYAPAHFRVPSGKGPVVFPTTTDTFIFDRYTGEQIYRFNPSFATGGPAVAHDNFLYMGSTGGRFYSLIINPELAQPMIKWEVLTSGPVTARPVLHDRHYLLMASQGGLVASCLARDKSYRWSYNTGGPILGDPVVDATGAYVASMDRSLYKINKSVGIVIWRTRFPRPLQEGPTVAGGTVFQYCDGKGITALDAATGAERWVHDSGRSFAAHSDSGDVIFTQSNTLEVLDPAKGTVQQSVPAPGVLKVISNGVDPSVYLLGTEGRVVCAKLDTTPYLRRQQILSARNKLNEPPDDGTGMQRPEIIRPQRPDPLDGDPLRSTRDKPKPKSDGDGS